MAAKENVQHFPPFWVTVRPGGGLEPRLGNVLAEWAKPHIKDGVVAPLRDAELYAVVLAPMLHTTTARAGPAADDETGAVRIEVLARAACAAIDLKNQRSAGDTSTHHRVQSSGPRRRATKWKAGSLRREMEINPQPLLRIARRLRISWCEPAPPRSPHAGGGPRFAALRLALPSIHARRMPSVCSEETSTLSSA